MKLPNSLGSKLLEHLAGMITGATTTLFGLLLVKIGRPIFDTALKHLDSETLWLIIGILTFVLALAFLWVWLLKAKLAEMKKPLSEKFDFDPHGGFYRDPKTGRDVCAACLADGKIIHLMITAKSGPRHCNVCNTSYRAPLRD